MTRTCVGPPGPVPATTSATPSPLKSAAAVRTPPVNPPGNASNPNFSAPYGPKNRTVGDPTTSAPTANSFGSLATGRGGLTGKGGAGGGTTTGGGTGAVTVISPVATG